MIRTMVLISLLAVIFYCAAAGSARADARVERANLKPLMQARLQFIPGSMASLHAVARQVAVALHTQAEPQA
jgi:hypothetical protein